MFPKECLSLATGGPKDSRDEDELQTENKMQNRLLSSYQWKTHSSKTIIFYTEAWA